MKVTSAAKVGLTVVLAALVLISIYKGLGFNIFGPSHRGYSITVSFASVKGLNNGADVQLNGNSIGEVEKIENTDYGEVLVTLRITSVLPIHKHASFVINRDSIFGSYLVSIEEPRSGTMTEAGIVNGEFDVVLQKGQARQGQLVIWNGEAVGQVSSVRDDPRNPLAAIAHVKLVDSADLTRDMAFVPTRSGEIQVYGQIEPGSIVSGTREPGPEDLVAEAYTTMTEITDQVSVVMNQISQLLNNIQELLGPEDIRNLLTDVTTQINAISSNIIELTDQMNVMLAESEPHITSTLENIDVMTSDARELVAGLNDYNSPEVRQNIEDLIANLESATEQLDQILTDVQAYTSDEQLREDIAGTFHEARARLQEAQGTLEAVNTAIDEASAAFGPDRFHAEGEFTFRYAPDPDHYAGDLNFQLGFENRDPFVIVGIDDIGENDRANAQLGWWVNDSIAARAGVNRGKLGVGFDWRSDAFRLVGDLYDPNDLTWDFYAGYAIMPEIDLIVGVEDAFNEDYLNFGLAYRF
jgi:ABC-type transporter Mla subunit MlaD